MSELRDLRISRVIGDWLASAPRIDARGISAEAKGQVVHLTGLVASEDERAGVRHLCARVRGVVAVWDLLQTAGCPPLRVVDIGCGPVKQYPAAHGFDGRAVPGVDVVLDLEHPLPIAGASVDRVFAVHVLEHVRNLVPLMNEIHRVLKPGGVLHAMAPSWRFVNAVADPTHVRYFDVQTFKYFCRASPGVKPFRPLMATGASDTVFADLIPVTDGEALPSDEELAEFFD